MNEKYKHLMKRLKRTAEFNDLEVIDVEGSWAFKAPIDPDEGIQHNIYASDDTHDYVISLTMNKKELTEIQEIVLKLEKEIADADI